MEREQLRSSESYSNEEWVTHEFLLHETHSEAHLCDYVSLVVAEKVNITIESSANSGMSASQTIH